MSSPVLDRLNQQVHLLVQNVTLLGILTCCSQTEGRRRCRIIVTVAILQRQYWPTLTCQVLIQTVGQISRALEIGTGPAGRVIQVQPIGNLRTNLSCRIVTVVLILIQLHETAIVQVVERSIEIKLIITAAHTCVMLLREGCALIQGIIPINVIYSIAVAIIPCCAVAGIDTVEQVTIGILSGTRTYRSGIVISHDLIHTLLIEEHTTTTIGMSIVYPCCIVNRVHHVLATNHTAEAEAVVIVDSNLTRLTFLGSNQDHTERRTGTIDRRCSSILQYRYTFDILWVDGIQITLRTINQDQWSTLGTLTNGSSTTYIYIRSSIHRTR